MCALAGLSRKMCYTPPMWLLVACDPAPPALPSDSSEDIDSAPPASVGESFDVVVVGTGPAGVAAALAAEDQGATVVMFERATEPGQGMRYAGTATAVDTPWQRAMGVEDSVELASSEWQGITGEPCDLPGVMAYLEQSSNALVWLEQHGFSIGAPKPSTDEGSVPRAHVIMWPPDVAPFTAIMSGRAAEVRVGVEVSGPLLAEGRVVGVTWRDLLTGEVGETRAGAVVLATGGFLRDLDAVNVVRPDLAAADPVFESSPTATGNGLPFLAAIGAARHKPEQIAAYLHSIQDPLREEGEALSLFGISHFILVGANGLRFTESAGLSAFEPALEAPEGGTWLLGGGEELPYAGFQPPGFNWADPTVVEDFTLEEVVALGSTEVFLSDRLDDAVAAAGLDPDAATEMADYNMLAAIGGDDGFGNRLSPDHAVEGPPWVVIRVHPGLSKNFGGVATDVSGHVLDESGVPIPGVYAAGEVAGMIPGGGSGTGFAGSAGACYYAGWLTGTLAATE